MRGRAPITATNDVDDITPARPQPISINVGVAVLPPLASLDVPRQCLSVARNKAIRPSPGRHDIAGIIMLDIFAR